MKTILSLLVAAAFFPAAACHAQIFVFNFNDSGTTTASGATNAQFIFRDGSTPPVYSPMDLHGAPGSGVSGLPGDRAFDNGSSTFLSNGGRAEVAAADAAVLNGLSSFTIAGWYHTSNDKSWAGARLVERNGGTNNQFSLFFSTGSTGGASAKLSISIGTSALAATVGSEELTALGALDTWIFFAVTYDGTLAEDNVRFYYGTTTSSVTQIGTALTLNAGSLGTTSTALEIGNNSVGSRPWDGHLDNIRIYGATGGSDQGVLDLAQLETLRKVDAIPEPSTVALLITAGLSLSLLRRRFCRDSDDRGNPFWAKKRLLVASHLNS